MTRSPAIGKKQILIVEDHPLFRAMLVQLVATTVDSYRARIKQKLSLKNAAELYQRAALWVAAPGA